MKENKEAIIKAEQRRACSIRYNRYPMWYWIMERACISMIHDGKKYLDFGSGYRGTGPGLSAIRSYDEALKAQIDKLMHTSNLYYNEPAAEAADKLVQHERHEPGVLHQQRHRSH